MKAKSTRFPDMLREILLFHFLLGVAFADNSANQYVDNVLQSSLEQELLSANLLPARLPEFTAILGSTKYGKGLIEVHFTFGNVTGLDRIKRKGDCTGPRTYKGEISINCTLSLFPLQSAHRTVVRNSTYANVGKVQAAVTEVLVDLQIVGRPQNYVGILKKFEVGNLDTLTPVFSNIPAYIRGDLPYLQKTYKTHVLGNLYGILSQKYADALRRAIALKPVPRQ
ncbi:uncharacterized protein LOC129975984 isoform X2 [Argiope bruennichi]|uniref:uncharacterized protein LOC129975984 isoform X2 n=1 Tax=Argiope bruennichi TaxID=94029 RepID=UPI002493F387|nr:uncharacterized protein LOC129975984 isoform X2 [Argiope bruennichi]